jgi:hypothetical protein
MRKNEKISKSLKRHYRIKKIKYRLKLFAWLSITSIAILIVPKVSAAPYEFYPSKFPEAKDRIIPMREWVNLEVKKAGLNNNYVDCIIKNESGWKQYAVGKNNNGTYDIGLWQINDIHEIPREVAFDYKKATRWAIAKVKRDGGFGAWYGAIKCK